MSDYKPMRLIAAAKKFNVGASTITEFLQGKGFDIDNRPTTKLSEEMCGGSMLPGKEFADARRASGCR